jgi:hypothetical protein
MNSVETVIMAEEYLIGNTISNQQKQAWNDIYGFTTKVPQTQSSIQK